MTDNPEPANLKVIKRLALRDMSEAEFTFFFGDPSREERLQQLLAEFEASVAKVKLAYMPKALNHPHDEIVPIELMSFTYLWENADGFIVSYEEADDIGLCQTRMFYQDWKFIRETYEAAKFYCIARDEGISAAVMWKLANGGAQ